ncbi:MAG TPA: family 78 glycoside hydrolase catalytic domain, partial [Lacipirellulaceae bacterium]
MPSTADKWRFLAANDAALVLADVAKAGRQKNARTRILDLKVDYVDCPLGLQNSCPSFTWRMESEQRNIRQTAYRICVATNEEALREGKADLWDSGKVSSCESLDIAYQGQALKSRQRCWWRVHVWDQDGRECEASPCAWWEMGLLSAQDWTAQWIAADDATAQADRATALNWMWGSAAEDRGEELRCFRATIDLPAATRGGVIFTAPSSFETVTRIWLDGAPLTVLYQGRNLTRENLPVGPLAPGKHLLAVEVRRRNPKPEAWSKPRSAGIALFARFDGEPGPAVRFVSGAAWRTSINPGANWQQSEHDDASRWTAVAISPVEKSILVDPAMHLRRVFSTDKAVVSARLYVTAMGCYDARLNGQRVGDALLTPEISQYDKRVYYRAYDVTGLVKPGANALGLTVGDGWYASHPGRYAWGPPPRRVIAQLECAHADGSRQVIATGPDWQVARSPIQQSEICQGEIYDARSAHLNWDTVEFNSANWSASQLAPAPACRLVGHVEPPIRAIEVLQPISISHPIDGAHVFDVGQDFAGRCRLHVKGKAGTRIDLRFASRLKPSGEIDQFVLVGGRSVDTYILRGDENGETFEPLFTYRGFRYVQVTGLPASPTVDMLEGIVMHSDLQPTGWIRSDHPLIGRLWRNILWAQRSNMVGIPTDCPDRAERMAYFGDHSVKWDTCAFNMDVAALTRQQLDHARDRQCDNGPFPPVTPAPSEFLLFHRADATAVPGWSDGAVILAWTNWRRYGDRHIIEQNWEAMNRYLNFILERNPDYLWLNGRGPDLGDWLAVEENHYWRPYIPPSTPFDLIATALWAHCADLLAQMADASGRTQEAWRLREVRERVRNAFIDRFVQADGEVGNGSQ